MQTIQKVIFFIILSLVSGKFSFGQKPPSHSVATIVKAIAETNIYEVSYKVGYAGSLSKQYQRFKQLLSVATEEQLLNLATRNENAVVRLYALQSLRQRKIDISAALTEQFNNDRAIVMMLNGCLMNKMTVEDIAKQNLKLFESIIQ